jgi:hypothetical protein
LDADFAVLDIISKRAHVGDALESTTKAEPQHARADKDKRQAGPLPATGELEEAKKELAATRDEVSELRSKLDSLAARLVTWELPSDKPSAVASGTTDKGPQSGRLAPTVIERHPNQLTFPRRRDCRALRRYVSVLDALQQAAEKGLSIEDMRRIRGNATWTAEAIWQFRARVNEALQDCAGSCGKLYEIAQVDTKYYLMPKRILIQQVSANDRNEGGV